MAADDRDPDAPSLEPPSLGLFRRRRRTSSVPAPQGTPEETPEGADQPETVQPAPGPAAGEAPEAQAPSQALTEPVEPVAPGEPVQARRDEEPTTVLPATAPPPPPLFTDEAAPDGGAGDGDRTAMLPPAVTADERDASASPRPERPRRPRRSTPLLTGVAAVLVTGLVVGLGTVGLTAGGMQACEAARGTSSCGGSGMLLLLVIVAAMVFLGGWLLRAFEVPDPGSTSFLAVGLLAVVALVFLIDHLLEWWMVIVIPLVSVATYALSHWVTVSVIEPARE